MDGQSYLSLPFNIVFICIFGVVEVVTCSTSVAAGIAVSDVAGVRVPRWPKYSMQEL